jgi:DNA recombination protein RmuC
MLDRCDFDAQVSVRGPDGLLRPDLVIRLPGERCVVVDAKVTLAAYLEAVETTDERVRAERTVAHARHLRAHVDRLADKAYWEQFPDSPEFVVLFLPGEAFLGPALEADPALLEYAYARGVHLATPTTLVTLLRAVAHGWRSASLAQDAKAVLDAGREVHQRLATLAGHVDKLGRSLNASVAAYNATVGSLERSLLPSARRMAELGVTAGEVGAPREVEDVAKPVTAPALLAKPVTAQALLAEPGRAGEDRPPGRPLSVLPEAASG